MVWSKSEPQNTSKRWNIVLHSPCIEPLAFAVADAGIVSLKRKYELIGSNTALREVLGTFKIVVVVIIFEKGSRFL